ncbi:MAG TPA: hypothetical protein VN851_06165 [Thermoanaerobaculia bacterium]|nr:hypothetical protein [Thermoanaerobaculia bacterium]
MSKPTSTAAQSEDRVYPLRTGKIRLTKATASEITRSVGVRPSEARIAKKVLLRMGLLAPKAVEEVSSEPAAKKKPGRSSK